MLSEEEAKARITTAVSPLPTEPVPLADALDRFAARELRASVSLPPFDNSAMDGYAVIASDVSRGARLRVVGEQPAGRSRNLELSTGEAVRIFTGAPIPSGADAVVMQEETRVEGEHVVIAAERVEPGEFIRRAGVDLTDGQKILRGGERLRPATLALLASQGINAVDVHRRARIAIVTTGDEIVPAGAVLQRGEIFESNAPMLRALATRAGAAVESEQHCQDNLGELRAALARGLRADALIISGGVSVGERDFVRTALDQLGVKLELWRVRVKPGKPFLFGTAGNCLVFALPGNPVSSFVTFLIFVRPALLRLMGAEDAELELPRATARLTHEIQADETRPHYVRGVMQAGRFSAVGLQQSHAISGLARANALLRVGPGETMRPDSEVLAFLLD